MITARYPKNTSPIEDEKDTPENDDEPKKPNTP